MFATKKTASPFTGENLNMLFSIFGGGLTETHKNQLLPILYNTDGTLYTVNNDDAIKGKISKTILKMIENL